MNNINIQKYKHIVQYFWDPEPRNDEEPDAPIWCLGKDYPPPESARPPLPSADENLPRADGSNPQEQTSLSSSSPSPSSRRVSTLGWPEDFLDDFESKIWITYRSNFPAIAKSEDRNASSSITLGVRLRSQFAESFTSDTGWGCMIRSGQSLLANTLSILLLDRDWRRGSEPEKETELLTLFADHPEAPFSIHRFVRHGSRACGKYPGEWFGPSATARCIE